MDEFTKRGIKAWSTLKKARRLTGVLMVDPSEILKSRALQRIAIQELSKANEQMNNSFQESEIEKERYHEIKNILKSAQHEYASLLSVPFWLGSIGVNIFIVVKLEVEIAAISKTQALISLKESIYLQLIQCGFNTDEIPYGWFGIYSEEECLKVANGNWFQFFK